MDILGHELALKRHPKGSKILGAAFSPLDVAGLALWVDFADPTTLTITSSPDIDAVLDKKGLLSFAQGTAAAKPHTSTIGSITTAALFDRTDDQLIQAACPFVANTGRFFAVVRFPTIGAANQNIFACGNSLTNNYLSAIRCDVVDTNIYFGCWSRVVSTINAVRSNSPVVANTTYVVSTCSNGSAYSIRINGVEQELTVSSGANNGAWFDENSGNLNSMTLGRMQTLAGAAFFGGLMGEVLYYDNVVLSAADITRIEQYLAAKWGVTLA